jgi:hypothetical protein
VSDVVKRREGAGGEEEQGGEDKEDRAFGAARATQQGTNHTITQFNPDKRTYIHPPKALPHSSLCPAHAIAILVSE